MDDPVVARERDTRECDIQLGVGGRVDNLGSALDRALDAAVCGQARVEHADRAVGVGRVLGRRAVAACLEEGGVMRDFVPLARIAVHVHARDGVERGKQGLEARNATAEQTEQGRDNYEWY